MEKSITLKDIKDEIVEILRNKYVHDQHQCEIVLLQFDVDWEIAKWLYEALLQSQGAFVHAAQTALTVSRWGLDGLR
jgi:hypothetical protein